jgi:hypothetical protein
MMASDSIRSDEWREFDAMLQELRLRIMADREASGHDAIEAALRSKIHGATFRDVVVMGHRAKSARLTTEREAVRKVLQGNAWKSVYLKDVAFEHARADQEKRLLAIDEEMRTIKRRLAELGQY